MTGRRGDFASLSKRAATPSVYGPPVPLRCTLKLRDGRVHLGYTAGFDPHDRSVWLTATPDSPAGTMFTLDRARVLVLESLDGRAVQLPTSTAYDDGGPIIRVAFDDGDALIGRRTAEVPGLGVWLEPAGRGRARAFVPADAGGRPSEAFDVDPHGRERSWSFLPEPPSLPPSRSSLTMPALPPVVATPTPATPAPTIVAPSLARRSGDDPNPSDVTPTDAMPVVSPLDLHSDRTQPVAMPLVPPPVPAPSKTWPDDAPPDSTSSITMPDLARPALDD